MAHKIRSTIQAIAQTGDAGAKRSLRASVCTAVGASLILLGARRKGAMGGALAAMGGASLYRALIDWLGSGTRVGAPGGGRKSPAGAPTPFENDTSYGWAPESGEPGETRAGFGRCVVYSTFGDDVGFAPESGDRVMDREAVEGFVPESCGPQEDRVLEGSEESFPASDAPSWTPGRT